MKPTSESDAQTIDVHSSYPYADKVTLTAKNLNVDKQGKFYQELIFSPVNPDTSKTLEFNFELSITMHEDSVVKLTSLLLNASFNLSAEAL